MGSTCIDLSCRTLVRKISFARKEKVLAECWSRTKRSPNHPELRLGQAIQKPDLIGWERVVRRSKIGREGIVPWSKTAREGHDFQSCHLSAYLTSRDGGATASLHSAGTAVPTMLTAEC